MADCVKNKVNCILKIDGVDDEFILAYHCSDATVLFSGYFYTYVDENLDDNWKDTRNRFPLEDWDNDEDRYFPMYYHEEIYVYISRKGKIFIFRDTDDGCSDPNEYTWGDSYSCLHSPKTSLEDGLEWMWNDYKDELNDPDKIYILDAQTDGGDHTDFILIDDPAFVESVGVMPRNRIYQAVQDYISKYDIERCEASHEVIKDGKVYDYEEYKALK